MQIGRVVKTGLIVGAVANVYDFVMNTYLFPAISPQPAWMHPMESLPIHWLVVGDFVAALVFIAMFDKVRAAFGAGAKGGAEYGLWAGVLMNFPLWILMHLLVKDWTYTQSWLWTIFGVAWAVIMGTIGAVAYDRMGAAKA